MRSATSSGLRSLESAAVRKETDLINAACLRGVVSDKEATLPLPEPGSLEMVSKVPLTTLVGHLLGRLRTLSLLRCGGLTLLLSLSILGRHGLIRRHVVHRFGGRM